MTAVDRFKGGEAEWVDWKFKFLNAVGTGSTKMRELLQWIDDTQINRARALTAEKAVEEMGIKDALAGTLVRMSGELYSYLVAATTDEALGGGLRAVVKGDGIEAWAELHKRYSQRIMSRMMRVFMECMYPKEVKVAEMGAAILHW